MYPKFSGWGQGKGSPACGFRGKADLVKSFSFYDSESGSSDKKTVVNSLEC